MDDDLQAAVRASFDHSASSGDQMLINLFDFIPHFSHSYKHKIIFNQI